MAPNESLEQKVNYGGLLLQALLEFWPKPYNTEDESDPEQVQVYQFIPIPVGIGTFIIPVSVGSVVDPDSDQVDPKFIDLLDREP